MYQCLVLSVPLGVCHMYKPWVALGAVHLKTTGFRLFIDYQNPNLTGFAPLVCLDSFSCESSSCPENNSPKWEQASLE